MIHRRNFLAAGLGATLASILPRASMAAKPQEAHRLLLGGDTNFAESYNPKSAALRGYKHSLEKLAPLMQRAGYTVLNLETPLTNQQVSPFKGKKKYLHWSDPEKAPASLKAHGVDAVSLANNHTFDFGPEGEKETYAALKRHGIAWFGAGANAAKASEPLLTIIKTSRGHKVTLAFFGFYEYRRNDDKTFKAYATDDHGGVNELSVKRFKSQLAELRTKIPNLYAIAFPHWGGNYTWATSKQKDRGRALIDAGADIVIGHHGHTLQEVEFYKDRWILYGIGNFMFNAPGRYSMYPDVLPFGLAVDLAFIGAAESKPEIQLYPVKSDNRLTDYQPKLAAEGETQYILQTLKERAEEKTRPRLSLGTDGLGAFVKLS